MTTYVYMLTKTHTTTLLQNKHNNNQSNYEKLPGVNLLFDFCVYIFYNCEYNYYINC